MEKVKIVTKTGVLVEDFYNSVELKYNCNGSTSFIIKDEEEETTGEYFDIQGYSLNWE